MGARPPYSRVRALPWRADYIHLRTLAVQLRTQASARLSGRGELSIVDVGCGSRPYEHIFGPFAAEYVGVDAAASPGVDVVANAENLPFEDGRFDCVVCTQMLEHTADPQAVVSEAFRILRPRGLAFVSTHGVSLFHPSPGDYWRWTHEGLARLFHSTADWVSVDVYPNGGSAAAVAYLVGRLLEASVQRLSSSLASPLVLPMNTLAWRIDRWRGMSPARPPAVASNYLVVAERDDGISPR